MRQMELCAPAGPTQVFRYVLIRRPRPLSVVISVGLERLGQSSLQM